VREAEGAGEVEEVEEVEEVKEVKELEKKKYPWRTEVLTPWFCLKMAIRIAISKREQGKRKRETREMLRLILDVGLCFE